MRSRTFLHVSLGILGLAAAYHLGARSATAQSGGLVDCAGFENGNAYAVVNRTLYTMSNGAPTPVHPGTIPGASAAIACGYTQVVLEDGSYYKFDNTFTMQWVLAGTFSSVPTQIRQESMGAVKARYR